MDYATACTLWTLPEPSHRVQKLINQFFTIADSREDNAGDRFAEDVFIADGVFMLPDGTFTGASEIRLSRKDAWTTLKARRHTVLKVYANDADGLDLILIGNLEMETMGGDRIDKQFVSRMVIEQGDSVAKLRQYRIISPTAHEKSPILEVQSHCL